MTNENLIKENWPNAVEGNFKHSNFGIIQYWTGEDKNRIVVRFRFKGQEIGESEKIFFIDLKEGDWVLSQISTFQFSGSKLKLTKVQSFKEYEELEKKYSSVIELFIHNRKSRIFF